MTIRMVKSISERWVIPTPHSDPKFQFDGGSHVVCAMLSVWIFVYEMTFPLVMTAPSLPFFKLVFKCLDRAETNKLFGDFPWRRNQLSGKVFGQKKVFFFVFSHCVEATLNEFLIEVELAAEVRTIGRGFSVFLFFYTK